MAIFEIYENKYIKLFFNCKKKLKNKKLEKKKVSHHW